MADPLTLDDQVFVNAMGALLIDINVDPEQLWPLHETVRTVLPKVNRAHAKLAPLAEYAELMLVRSAEASLPQGDRRDFYRHGEFRARQALTDFFRWRLACVLHARDGASDNHQSECDT